MVPSHAERAGNKRILPEELSAIQYRFLEMCVFQQPHQDQQDLERSDGFNRQHFILGTYTRAIDTLEKYSPSDFHSRNLPAYVIGALGKNAKMYEEVMEGDQNIRDRVFQLAQKFATIL